MLHAARGSEFDSSITQNQSWAPVRTRRDCRSSVVDRRRQIENKTAGPAGPAAVNRYWSGLEHFLQADVPEPAFDIGERLVVAVLKGAGHERRILVKDVLHTELDRGLIQPGSPSAWIILGGRDRHHVLLFAILHLYVLTTLFREARHFCRRRWRQIECVRRD